MTESRGKNKLRAKRATGNESKRRQSKTYVPGFFVLRALNLLENIERVFREKLCNCSAIRTIVLKFALGEVASAYYGINAASKSRCVANKVANIRSNETNNGTANADVPNANFAVHCLPYVHGLTHSASSIRVVRIEQGDAESEKLKLAFVEKHPILLANRAPLLSHVAIPIGLFLIFLLYVLTLTPFIKISRRIVSRRRRRRKRMRK